MKCYPLTIVDNFFDNPDYVRELGLSLNYPDHSGQYPGLRSDYLHNIDRVLFQYIGNKIYSFFDSKNPDSWTIRMQFQKVKPFSQDKWDIRNRGWIHRDDKSYFGGVIYLNKNADPDTGTSVYRSKNGFQYFSKEEDEIKRKLYEGDENFNIDEYTKEFINFNNQFIETVKIDNVYNRLVLFDNATYHGVRTYGIEDRLTIAFFCENAQFYIHPLLRS